MATIRKRSTKQWQVQVRIAGHPTLSKTFTSKVEANKWANEKEDEIRFKVGIKEKERKFKVVTGNKKREVNRTHAQPMDSPWIGCWSSINRRFLSGRKDTGTRCTGSGCLEAT